MTAEMLIAIHDRKSFLKVLSHDRNEKETEKKQTIATNRKLNDSRAIK